MKQVSVILFGVGGVGRALLEQLINGRYPIIERNQIRFNVVAVCDSSRWLFKKEGLSTGQLRDVVWAKKNGRYLTDDPHRPTDVQILEQIGAAGIEKAIVVDGTAVDGTEPVLNKALDLGYGIVLANKKALAADWTSAQAYFNHPSVRYESTVGGGQPVIATLRYLLDVNDPIYQIEGQLSGSLGVICRQLDNGVAFSEAVADAKECGFTEPDPREDLSGADVMRKLLILGRMAGWSLSATDIEVESLFTPQLAALSVAEFVRQVASLDEAMQKRGAAAAAKGCVLRYVAQLQEGRGRVGLKALPLNSPLANLKYISFRTERYNDEPLLIGGKGTGVDVTASGVLGDMIDLVRETM